MRNGRKDSLGRRLEPKERKKEIMRAALVLAERHGYQNVGRNQIAEAVGCTPSLIGSYFGTMPKLQRAIISAAINTENLTVLAQGLAAGESKAKAAPDELKQRAVAAIL